MQNKHLQPACDKQCKIWIMPNQVKENKSEKKFKGEVLGINDKL